MAEIVRGAGAEFLKRFERINRRLLALEAFMGSINSTSAQNGSNVSTSSTSYVASSPTATGTSADVGLSSNMLVIASVECQIATGATASFALYQSGSLLIDPFGYLQNNTGGTIAVPAMAATLITGVTPAYTSTSFEIRFKSSSGSTSAIFGDPTIIVIPV